MSHYRHAAGLLLFLFVLPGCKKSNDQVAVLECTGTCTCDQETRTCTCSGGTDCALAGEESSVTFECDGNATCDLTCGTDCHVVCPGTAGCTATMGDGSTAVCNGTGDCHYTCVGDCSVDCPGASSCTLTCPMGATCEITSCPQMVDCGDGVLACRNACPP